MAYSIEAPRSRTPRLPATAVVAGLMLVVLLIGSAVLPQPSAQPEISWRGNSGSLPAAE